MGHRDADRSWPVSTRPCRAIPAEAPGPTSCRLRASSRPRESRRSHARGGATCPFHRESRHDDQRAQPGADGTLRAGGSVFGGQVRGAGHVFKAHPGLDGTRVAGGSAFGWQVRQVTASRSPATARRPTRIPRHPPSTIPTTPSSPAAIESHQTHPTDSLRPDTPRRDILPTDSAGGAGESSRARGLALQLPAPRPPARVRAT